MRLQNFDLNLLVAFHALVEERSVTKAARRLNVTQPAMSASLKRLREAFQDEILVQHGKKMFPTPHALTLAPEVEATLIHMRGLITSGSTFDPTSSRRQFRIIASDYIMTVLIVPLIDRLQKIAPGIMLDTYPPNARSSRDIENGEADLLISPEEFINSDHPREKLLEERLVIVGCQSNATLADAVSMERFLSCGHVSVRIEGRSSFIENALAQIVPMRKVEVTAQSFIQVPWLLRNTSRLAVMHERLALHCCKPLSLRIADAAFDLPVMQELMMFHAARRMDEGLSWLRQELIAQANLAQAQAN